MKTRPHRFAALILGVALVAAACSSGSAGSSEVRPFAEIQASEFAFEIDPISGRGIFRVTTTEPAICAVVWGETAALGNFNNSLGMAGTGIEQHDVALPGSEPGATYHFRVQGSTADGTLYQSDLGTFTLPESEAADPAMDSRENLALGAVVLEASSEFSAAWASTNAVDGDPGTEWATRGDGDGGFLILDLGATRQVAAVEFITRSMADGSAITSEFTVTVDDGETLGPFPAGTPVEARTAEVSFTGRVLRFDITASTGGNVGAVEIRVLAP